MASSNYNENATQCKTCRSGETDTNIWTTRTFENPDKQFKKCPTCQVLKTGTLFISSKGIGWTSWKKRWFVLTRTSLVFYRNDPNATPLNGSEPNLTLGGIDLNSSGSVVVKADKKLLTMLFPDGRDGRTFTLKAETLEDLYQWKTALENALARAPSAALALGQNGIFHDEAVESIEASFEHWRDMRTVKSLVVGRPILLALEDIDGTPSFLEKALRFIEEHGIKVEGILRQSADVEEVHHRVQEYEQGKNEFSPDEDAHVIGDCIKHVLRELASSPVPATCCTALVEAYRTDRGSRINAMHAAIAETFPEPNRRLVQRILKMMRTVASHKLENRMTLSALAACMAPLLLRPLLSGDCELEDDFNMGGDGSIQLLQAAAAANHAQAIIIILLEEYEKIFDEDLLEDLSSELYSESEDSDVEEEELTDNDIFEEDGYHDADNGLEADLDDDADCSSSGTINESNSDVGSNSYDNEVYEDYNNYSSSHKDNEIIEATKTLSSKTTQNPELRGTTAVMLPLGVQNDDTLPSKIQTFVGKSNKPQPSTKRPTVWGRTSARKNLSMESDDLSSEDETAIERLEMTKIDLQSKITKEVDGNATLLASLEKQKEALHERRLALEKDVGRLREQLQKERDLRASLEAGLMNLRPGLLTTSSIDSRATADLEEIALAEADIINLKQKASDLRGQLGHQLHHSFASFCEPCSQHIYAWNQLAERKQQNDIDSCSLLNRNEKSSMTVDVFSGATFVNKKSKEDLPFSTKSCPSHKQQSISAAQSNTISSGFKGSSSSKQLPTVNAIALYKNLSTENENALLRAGLEDLKAQTLDSPSSHGTSASEEENRISPTSRDENPLPQADRENVKAQAKLSATESERTKSISSNEATCNRTIKKLSPKKNNFQNSISQGQNTTIQDAILKNSTSRNDDSIRGDNCKNIKILLSSDKQRECKSLGPKFSLSTEESTTSAHVTDPKKYSFMGKAVKKDAKDPPSLHNNRLSQKQQPNTSNLNSMNSPEEMMRVSSITSSKKPTTRSEETIVAAGAASSPLTKLTSRLNFLKERRVQLVHELQNIDSIQSEGPEAPPLRTNSR